MTTRDEIETMLLQAVSVEPSSSGLLWLDQRVAAVAARPVELRRAGTPGLRFFLRPLALAAALLLLAGAVAAGLGLLDQAIDSSGSPGWRVAWDRAEKLDLTATDAGVTITLERAYADLNQVLVGFTVAGLEAPLTSDGERAPLEWVAELTDPSGRTSQAWATTGTHMRSDVTGLSAVVQTWEGTLAPDAGTWVLSFTSVGYFGGGLIPGQCYVGATDPECVSPPPSAMVDGNWRFEFELPEPSGSVFSTAALASTGVATVKLTELRITPTAITARIALAVPGSTVLDWVWLPPSIRHGDVSYAFNRINHVTQDPATQGSDGDVNDFLSTAGADDPSGTWQIVIPELTYRVGSGEEYTVSGPWTLTVTVP
jgi:hypothetical protein